MNRRRLLQRAGLATVAIGLGGALVLDRTLWNDRERIEYLPGFNDDFLTYSTTDFADATMERVRTCGGRLVRFGVNWGEVQADGPASHDWSAYDRLYAQALAAGVQLLPTVYGCPEWAGPVVTATLWPGNNPPLPPDYFRTCSPGHDPDFGNFAAATLRHFDAFSRLQGRPTVVTAVEILNEPNVWTFGGVPATRLRELSVAAADRVAASQKAGAFSQPMRVVSGGIAPVTELEPGNPLGYPPRPSWQEYLEELLEGAPADFDVGFHSFETSKPPAGVLTIPEDDSDDPFGRAGQFAEWQSARILDRIDEALALAPGDLWLTETGASSESIWSVDVFSPAYRAEHGQRIQTEVLTGIADGLGSRPRCRSMLVHRLYTDDLAEPPPGADSDSPHHGDGVYESTGGEPKLAVSALADAWS